MKRQQRILLCRGGNSAGRAVSFANQHTQDDETPAKPETQHDSIGKRLFLRKVSHLRDVR